jgi:hypothetical protein
MSAPDVKYSYFYLGFKQSYNTIVGPPGAQLAGAFLSMSLIHAMFLILMLRLAFSKRVRLFFHGDIKNGRV